ncbi:MAG TPA: 3-dehydroquinate synthase family protein [Acidimicrobiales bacterium]|nr:3-dehydroquinate synthase family protein [Acidimicrobiales bacterium]
MRKVLVELGDRSYPVLIGAGARHELGPVLPRSARKAAVVTQAPIGVQVETGLEQTTIYLGEGEEEKNLASVERLCREFARFGLTRADVVIGVGGGVVTDVAGFAASVYHRGVPVVYVATTLLAQVDAAIGGKTGVNLPEGKNLLGAFWQPAAVLCDTEVLSSLPPREYRSGLGEMAKYAFLGVSDLPKLGIEEAVARCVECKAGFVAADERESLNVAGGPRAARPGRDRALLNYGHTLAHALETVGDYDLRHGEAVAIGLVFAARLARALGRIDERRVAEHEAVVASYDLPARIPAGTDAEGLVKAMARDKKATTGALTFVLDGSRGLEVVPGAPAEMVRRALDEMH